MHRNIRPRSVGRWAWCVMCGGNFRSIRYPFEHAEFCTKRCLDRYFLPGPCRGRAAHEFERVVQKRAGRNGTVEPVPSSFPDEFAPALPPNIVLPHGRQPSVNS